MTSEEIVIGSDVLVAHCIFLDFKFHNTVHQQERESASTCVAITDPMSSANISERLMFKYLPMRQDLLNVLNVLQGLEIASSLFCCACCLL